jgi:hypothetical protein
MAVSDYMKPAKGKENAVEDLREKTRDQNKRIKFLETVICEIHASIEEYGFFSPNSQKAFVIMNSKNPELSNIILRIVESHSKRLKEQETRRLAREKKKRETTS